MPRHLTMDFENYLSLFDDVWFRVEMARDHLSYVADKCWMQPQLEPLRSLSLPSIFCR